MNIDYFNNKIVLFPEIIPLTHKSLTYDTLNDDIIKVYYKEIDDPMFEKKYSYIDNNKIEDCDTNINTITNIVNKNKICKIIKIKKASDEEKKYFLKKIKLPIYKKYFGNGIKCPLSVDEFIKLKRYCNIFYNYFIIVDYEKDFYVKPYDCKTSLSKEICNKLYIDSVDDDNNTFVKSMIGGFTQKERENNRYFTLLNEYLMNNK